MADFDQFLEQFEERPRAYPPEVPVLDQPCGRRWRFVSPLEVIVGAGRMIGSACLFAYAILFWGAVATIIILLLLLAVMEAIG